MASRPLAAPLRAVLDPTAKDKFGLPVASVHYDDHPNDLAMRAHAYKQGAAVYEAVGATVTYPTPPYPSTHNLGTNRMSENAHLRDLDLKGLRARWQSVFLRPPPPHFVFTVGWQTDTGGDGSVLPPAALKAGRRERPSSLVLGH
jgi:hypothetical protein